jgi:hypothetical protein
MGEPTGAELIAAERRRHREVEGWTPSHDSEHDAGELVAAADCYLYAAEGIRSAHAYVIGAGQRMVDRARGEMRKQALADLAQAKEDPLGYWLGRERGGFKVPRGPLHRWPWEPEGWKPSDDPIRNLVKAGSLIAAEIDRLLAEPHPVPSPASVPGVVCEEEGT